MKDLTDYHAQCLIDDGEGVIFLCPLHKRDEALAYFEGLHNYENEGDNPQKPFPSYLHAISSFDELVFYGAHIEPVALDYRSSLGKNKNRNLHTV